MDTSERLALLNGTLRIAESELSPEEKAEFFLDWCYKYRRAIKLIHGQPLKSLGKPAPGSEPTSLDGCRPEDPVVGLFHRNVEQARKEKDIAPESSSGEFTRRYTEERLILCVRTARVMLYFQDVIVQRRKVDSTHRTLAVQQYQMKVRGYEREQTKTLMAKLDLNLWLSMQEVAMHAHRSAEEKLRDAAARAGQLFEFAFRSDERVHPLRSPGL